MRILTAVFSVSALFLLSHCAAKHQPLEFPGYFALLPESEFTLVQSDELKALEALPQPTGFQKRRMVELYQNQQRPLKPTSPLYVTLDQKIQQLKNETTELEAPIVQLQAEIAGYPNEDASPVKPVVFSDPNMKKAFTDAAQLWNRDEPTRALERLDAATKLVENSLSAPEKLRIQNLKFRIHAESSDLKLAAADYAAMKSLDDCHADTTQAGFLLSVLSFAQGDSVNALKILEAQCDKDTSELAQQRRSYWKARFQEGQGTISATLYQSLASARIPAFYSFLAEIRLGQKVNVPPAPATKGYLAQEFNVPGEIHQLLLSAEERLKWNLKKDAMAFLMKASRRMRKTPGKSEVVPLLYIAHLCQAAGNHLEALRIYAQVTQLVTQDPELSTLVTASLLSEMYPRPFDAKVDWLSKMWDVDGDYVYSIIRQESAFSPTAVSGSDARGLMQLMPALAKILAKQWSFKTYYTDRSLFDADENLKLGVFHLKQLDKLVPHPALIAAGYNAGVNRAIRWWKRYGNYPLDVFIELIPVSETRNYVKLVLRNYYFYKNLRTGQPVDPTQVPFQLAPIPAEYISKNSSPFLPRWTRMDSTRLHLD